MPKFFCWSKQGNAPYKILSPKQSLFLSKLNFMEIIRLTKLRSVKFHDHMADTKMR